MTHTAGRNASAKDPRDGATKFNFFAREFLHRPGPVLSCQQLPGSQFPADIELRAKNGVAAGEGSAPSIPKIQPKVSFMSSAAQALSSRVLGLKRRKHTFLEISA